MCYFFECYEKYFQAEERKQLKDKTFLKELTRFLCRKTMQCEKVGSRRHEYRIPYIHHLFAVGSVMLSYSISQCQKVRDILNLSKRFRDPLRVEGGIAFLLVAVAVAVLLHLVFVSFILFSYANSF